MKTRDRKATSMEVILSIFDPIKVVGTHRAKTGSGSRDLVLSYFLGQTDFWARVIIGRRPSVIQVELPDYPLIFLDCPYDNLEIGI